MRPVICRLVASSIACGSLACATAPSTPPSTLDARDRGDQARTDPGEDVDILRERVTRLERRMADVDAKLGLLIAQRQQREPRDRAYAERAPARDYRPRGDERPREEASLGARAVDLPARGGVEDIDEAIDAPAQDDGEDPVVIRLDGRGAPAEEARVSNGPQITLGASVDEVYQWGLARLKAGQTLEALAAFEDVTSHASAHDLADNAMYWTGQAHAQRGDHKLALDVWQRLPIRYPKSPKISDVLYGMAQSHEALGEPALAETLYLELVTQYPKAEKVRDAQKALRRLRPR